MQLRRLIRIRTTCTRPPTILTTRIMDTRISTGLRLISFLAFPLTITITAMMAVTTGMGTLPGRFPIVAA